MPGFVVKAGWSAALALLTMVNVASGFCTFDDLVNIYNATTQSVGCVPGGSLEHGSSCIYTHPDPGFACSTSTCVDGSFYSLVWDIRYVDCQPLGCLVRNFSRANIVESYCEDGQVVTNGGRCSLYRSTYNCEYSQCIDGVWTIDSPTCLDFASSCRVDESSFTPRLEQPTLPLGAVVLNGNGMSFTRLGHTCGEITCTNGKWSGPAVCTPVGVVAQCAVDELLNATAHANTTSSVVHGSLTTACADNVPDGTFCDWIATDLEGNPLRCSPSVCSDSDWLPERIICGCAFDDLVQPTIPVAFASGKSFCVPGGVAEAGDECDFFIQEGACVSTTCGSDGSWSVEVIQCIEKACRFDDLDIPLDAKVSQVGCQAGKVVPDTEHCVLEVEGTSCDFPTCLDGVWTTTHPHCYEGGCPGSSLIRPQSSNGTRGVPNPTTCGNAAFAAKQNQPCDFTMQGAECERSGCLNSTWTTETPICKELGCSFNKLLALGDAVSANEGCQANKVVANGEYCAFHSVGLDCQTVRCNNGDWDTLQPCTKNVATECLSVDTAKKEFRRCANNHPTTSSDETDHFTHCSCSTKSSDEWCLCTSSILGPDNNTRLVELGGIEIQPLDYCGYFDECLHDVIDQCIQNGVDIDGDPSYAAVFSVYTERYTETIEDFCFIDESCNSDEQVRDDERYERYLECTLAYACVNSSDPDVRCSQDCTTNVLTCAKEHCSALASSSDLCAKALPNGPFCFEEDRDLERVCQLAIETTGSFIEREVQYAPLIVALSVGVPVFLCLICFAAYWKCKRDSDVAAAQQRIDEAGKLFGELGPGKDTTPDVIRALIAGDWTRGKLLGRGQFGSVYLALLPNGVALAAKQLDAHNQSEEDLQSYLREIGTMRDLDHPNIVKYYYACYDNVEKLVTLFMEYVPGGSLGKMVRSMDKPLSEMQGRIFIRQILLGLYYLHEHFVIHRDIKGDNILFDATEGVCKISDFGSSKKLAQTVGSQTIAKTITGTPNWMAPEVITNAGLAEHNEKVDIWSVAATTVEILNKGTPPWPEFTTHWAAIYHIASSASPPPIPAFFSEGAIEFLLLCFQRDPSLRPSCSELLDHPWLRVEGKSEDDGVESPATKVKMDNHLQQKLLERKKSAHDQPKPADSPSSSDRTKSHAVRGSGNSGNSVSNSNPTSTATSLFMTKTQDSSTPLGDRGNGRRGDMCEAASGPRVFVKEAPLTSMEKDNGHHPSIPTIPDDDGQSIGHHIDTDGYTSRAELSNLKEAFKAHRLGGMQAEDDDAVCKKADHMTIPTFIVPASPDPWDADEVDEVRFGTIHHCEDDSIDGHSGTAPYG
ncbi:Mitogen-activated protein kinase kinase kinase ANP1 [Diplonema papillatum]|nr:Mitogen-activated protein kinase kinase kinase ANP1 [Diplonema papillatum]